jgi:ABC-type dipeptide/oligopeptide/nickel transport system permease component
VVGYLVRRVVHGGIVLFVVALLIYGMEPALRPENYPGQAVVPLVWHDAERALLHLDFGHSCGWPGCPRIHTLWVRGLAGDLWMLAGGLLLGVLGGVSAGAWCARRHSSTRARVVEAMAIAKGVRYGPVVRRHAARGAYPGVTSLVWAYIPIFVTNVVFVEWVWNVPGFWFATRRAIDQDPFFPGIDVPMLKALSLWTALVIVVLSTAADLLLGALDPRVRAGGRP